MSFWWCVHVLQHLRPHLKRHFWGRNKTNMWDSLREQVRAAEPPQPPHTHCGQKKTQKELEVRRTRTGSSSSSQVRTRSSTQNSDSQDSHFSASAFDALTHRSNLRLFFFSCRSPQTRSSTAPKADPDLKLWVIWGDRERQKVPEHISSAQTEASEKIFSVKLTKSLRSAERWLLPLCLQPVQLQTVLLQQQQRGWAGGGAWACACPASAHARWQVWAESQSGGNLFQSNFEEGFLTSVEHERLFGWLTALFDNKTTGKHAWRVWNELTYNKQLAN